MKNIILFGTVSILLALTSCKKQLNDTNTVTNVTPVITIPSDTSSFTLNGKQYSGNNSGAFVAGNTLVNVTLDPVDKITQHGSTDSVLYYRTYTINAATAGSISLSFVKKYAKTQLQTSASNILAPSTPLGLFTVGQHPFAVDFNRENSKDGVAVQVTGIGSSYFPLPLNVKTNLTASSQNNSTFQVITLTKLDNGAYILEAKFSANLYDNNENLQRLENGYIRIRVY